MKNTLTVDAATFLAMPVIDTCVALEICEIDGKTLPAVKAKLIKLYGDMTGVVADGKPVNLSDITGADEISVGAREDFKKQRYTAADALRVIERLARDGDGCPWDRAQTHESIRINLIEEAYEAVDAIDKHDVPNMREEFGDVFLQSILQSEIARKNGEFDFNDVCDELCKKLIGRHTFIFGDDSATNPDEALNLWEKAKGIEKHYDTVKTQLSKLPETFPSLLYSQKTYKKLKKAGITSDLTAQLKGAVESGDYALAIDACAALLCEQSKDAEVELNKLVKNKIANIK